MTGRTAEDRRSGAGEGRADVGGVRGAPQNLPHRLRMPRDASDACLPEVQLRLINRRDFEEVEGGGVQEEERQHRRGEHQRPHPRLRPQVPQLHTVVSVVFTGH